MRHLAQKGLAVSQMSHLYLQTSKNGTQTPESVSKLDFPHKIDYSIIVGLSL